MSDNQLLPIPMDEHIFEVIFGAAKEQGIESHLAHNHAVAVADIATKTGNDNPEKVMSELSGLANGIVRAMKSIMPANAEVIGIQTTTTIGINFSADGYFITCDFNLGDKRFHVVEPVDEVHAKELAKEFGVDINSV